MLLVEIDGLLDGLVADYVAVGEVLGDDTRAWLVFGSDVVLVVSCLAAGNVADG